MDMPVNRFKAALARGELQIGLWGSLCSSIVAEAVSDSNFDWYLIDTEHSANEPPMVMSQLQAMQGGTTTPIVRPAWNDPVLIKRLLDIGTTSLLMPFVQTGEEAAAAVAACRYPPAGMRGVAGGNRGARYGRVKDYLKNANDQICVLVQVETAEGLKNLEAIAAAGVDGVFIGPNDLAASLGHIGEQTHPEVQAAIQDAAKRLTAVGTAPGILTPSEADAKRYIEWGYKFVAVGSDLGLLIKHADALVANFKS